ncbi:MAG: class I SAM-dependent methyltransferase [Clostridiales bacterium]|nr:class I SAM-dependent methyltransferase [Clostridiales bacterium]
MAANNEDRPCSLCGGGKHRLHFALNGNVFRRCRSCGLIKMAPLPERLAKGDDYAGYDLERQRQFTRLFFVPQYWRALRLIQRYKSGGRLLDVGCGTGEFLDLARQEGFLAFGIEPSERALFIARRSHPVAWGELNDISLKENFFDVVTLWSVLEHVIDPISFLRKVWLSLKKDGILGLRVPSSRGLLALSALWLHRLSAGKIKRPLKVIYQLEWHYKHFYYYDRKNIALLLEKCGFEILETYDESAYSISSLDFRMDYLPRSKALRTMLKAALFFNLHLSRLLRRQDELVIVAKKSGRPLSSP